MNSKYYKIIFLVMLSQFLLVSLYAFQTGGEEENPFVVFYDEGPVTVQPGGNFNFQVLFQIPDKSYLYEEKLDLFFDDTQGIVAQPFIKPQAVMKEDPFFKRMVPIYYHEVVAEVTLAMPHETWKGEKILKGTIQYQGCSEKLCYRLMKIPFSVSFQLARQNHDAVASKNPEGLMGRFLDFMKAPDFNSLTKEAFWLALLVAFIGGVLTDLTPCVWPMIPVTLTVIGVRQDKTVLKNFLAVLVMIVGMALVYSVLGVLAAFFGKSLGFLFQNIFFLILVEVILILMALSLLGFFEIRLPASLQNWMGQVTSSSLKGIFFVGLTLGFLASPCVGPVVGPLLVFVAQTKSITSGFFLLLSYALGMGVIFLVLGSLYGVIRIRVRSGPWTLWLKRLLGVLMLIVAFYYGKSIYAQLKIQPLKTTPVSIEKALDLARQESKPVIVDFFAHWCPPCLELDNFVWSEAKVRQQLENKWVFIKIDCTQETDECRHAISQFGVYGWPTVIFLDRYQNEAIQKRLVGRTVSADEMLDIMNSVEDRE